MRRTTPAVTALTGAAIALALTGCGGSAARQQASGPAHVSLAAAQAPAASGVSAASGSKAAAPAAPAGAQASGSTTHAAASSRAASSGHSKHGGRSGSGATASAPAAAPSGAAASTVTAAAAGGGGGGGGGKVTPVPAPADWPAGVPIPAGTITAASGAVSHWTVNVTVKGADTVVIAKLVALYSSKKFVPNPAFNNPKVLTRNRLTLTIFWRNRDHGPEATEVLLVLDKR